MVKIVNLTPHVINLLVDDEVVEIEPCGFVLRVGEKIITLGYENGIKIIKKVLDAGNVDYKTVKKLKEYAKYYDFIIVSLPCKELILNLFNSGFLDKEEANKFYILGNLIRDEQGRVLYADSLSKIL